MDSLKYEWINPREIVEIQDKRLILFGAGFGTEEFLEYLGTKSMKAEVFAIVDNDASYWGKSLNTFEIISPEALRHMSFDKIVVTSISGREAIALQLEGMGYTYPRDYLLVGRYPKSHIQNFSLLMNGLDTLESLKGARCLHIGPGGFLGLEVLLYCLGASRVSAIDKYAFGMHYPDVSNHHDDYMEILDVIPNISLGPNLRAEVEERFADLFISKDDKIYFDQERIDYHYPMDVCQMDLADETYDMVMSFAVLEHVKNPEAAIAKISKVLKPGGLSIHQIATEDHRSYANVSDSGDVFSFRSFSAEAWEALAGKKFYQNRLLPIEWKRLFEHNGLKIEKYAVTKRYEIDDDSLSRFHPDFNAFSLEELGEINCFIMARHD